MALIDCPNCGKRISDKAHACPFCKQKLLLQKPKVDDKVIKPANQQTNVIGEKEKETTNTSMADIKPKDIEITLPPKESSKTWLWVTIIASILILIGGGIGGFFYYNNIYLPEKIDREAQRTYPIVNVQLRSSKMTGGEFNKVATIPFGAELITYEQDSLWARVKYISPNPNAKPLEGFVASPYIVTKSDFYLINSIFGDNDAREVLATAKVRKALLEYYKSKRITGRLTSEYATEVGLPYNPQNQWQVFFHHGLSKPNEVLFKRVWNTASKFTDMAVIIENIATGNRQIVYVTFDDDETPHIRKYQDAPNNVGILDYTISSSGLRLTFSDGYTIEL